MSPDQSQTPGAGSQEEADTALLEQTIRSIRRRLPGVVVQDTRDKTLVVELPAIDAKAIEAVRAKIEQLGSVEMRVVATDNYVGPGGRFDLARERARLDAWLRKGGKEHVWGTPLEIRKFNEDPDHGPLAHSRLGWFPHIIRPSPGDRTRWAPTWTADPTLAPAVVAVFEAKQWNDGVVPAESGKRELLEYVAVNMHEIHFTGDDLERDRVWLGRAQDKSPAIYYSIRAGKRDRYAEWSEKYIGKCSAIIVNGEVRSAPCVVTRLPGYGQIQGSFSAEELEDLAATLRGGALLVRPEFIGMYVLGGK